MRLDKTDAGLIPALCGDIGRERKPYRNMAAALGIDEDQLLDRIRKYRDQGIMRRFGAILAHRKAGFTVNAMCVWNVIEDEISETGTRIASFSAVSHCYARPRFKGFPYNLYAMIHADDITKCEELAEKIARKIGNHEFVVLLSEREFKKSSPVYRPRKVLKLAH